MPSGLTREWKLVRVRKTRQNENPEPRFGSVETERALERFSVDVNRNNKGVPRGAQIRFELLTAMAGLRDGKGILEGPQGAGGRACRRRREQTGSGAGARSRRLDRNPLD